MTKLTAFADDSASLTIGKLTIENGTDSMAIYGSLDLTRDKPGLDHALALKAVIDDAVRALQAVERLPDAIKAPPTPREISNPFS